MGIVYRSWQLWQALLASPSADEMELVYSILSPEKYRLFMLMHPSEQAHSIKVMHRLIDKGHLHSDLLMAALLHDVGKISHPVQLWERVWSVIGNTFFPNLVSRWLQKSNMRENLANPFRRVFIIYDQHPVWGAKLAQEAGANTLCVNLICRHQEKISSKPITIEDQLLKYLQEADNLS